jgi:hypothetical protein
MIDIDAQFKHKFAECSAVVPVVQSGGGKVHSPHYHGAHSRTIGSKPALHTQEISSQQSAI